MRAAVTAYCELFCLSIAIARVLALRQPHSVVSTGSFLGEERFQHIPTGKVTNREHQLKRNNIKSRPPPSRG